MHIPISMGPYVEGSAKENILKETSQLQKVEGMFNGHSGSFLASCTPLEVFLVIWLMNLAFSVEWASIYHKSLLVNACVIDPGVLPCAWVEPDDALCFNALQQALAGRQEHIEAVLNHCCFAGRAVSLRHLWVSHLQVCSGLPCSALISKRCPSLIRLTEC